MNAVPVGRILSLVCHDGIPLLDLEGLLTDEQIESLITTVVGRGGHVKDRHGQKNMYNQVNATFSSALDDDEQKLLLARAMQIFMPGKPQVRYLDLFAGKNNAAPRCSSGVNDFLCRRSKDACRDDWCAAIPAEPGSRQA